jgi:thioredoxin 2
MPVVSCPACGKRARVQELAPGLPRCPGCRGYLPWLVEAAESTFDAEARAPVPVLVDLWAPWCAPCQAVAPVLERLASRHAGRIKIVKVNTDESPHLAARFDASSIPLLVVLQDGEAQDRIVGAQPLPALEARLAPYLER